MPDIYLQGLCLGMIGTNCYFAQNPDTKEMFIVDPADSADRIERKVTEMGGTPVAILLTHGHYDHMLAADEVRNKYDIPVYVEEEDVPVLADPMKNLSGAWSRPHTMKADRTVRDGDVLHIAGYEIHVLHTPGHTIGSCCYYIPSEKVLFSGDTLFCESFGRTDFPTSSSADMTRSVHRLLNELPDDVNVLPGHESYTTIGHEKRYNPLSPRNDA